MAVKEIRISRFININPTADLKLVHFLSARWTEMIEEGLNVLLHSLVELANDGVFQLEEVKSVMPTSCVGPDRGVLRIGHQPLG